MLFVAINTPVTVTEDSKVATDTISRANVNMREVTR